MRKKLITLLFAFMACVTLLQAETYSGTCGAEGNNLAWELNTETGVLTISGTGRYNTYVSLYQNPWDSYRLDIKMIVINEGLTFAGNYMFYECSNVTSVTLPESLTELGYEMFGNCRNLSDINLPNTVSKIGYRAFWHCENLTSILIPESVTSIANEAFSGCNSLSNITVAEGNPVYDSRNNCNAIIEKATNSLLFGCKNTIIPNSVTSIGQYAFLRNDSLNSIVIPQNITSIEYGAFSSCENLKHVTLNYGIKSIGNDAFGYCRNLTSIHLPASINSIGDNAFSSCKSLTSVTIPNSVTSIGYAAFENSGLVSIVIHDSITSIGDRAFCECSDLTYVMCYAPEPPTLGGSVFRDDYMHDFYDNNNNATLYVPSGSIDLYKAADQWKDFTNILPLSDLSDQCIVASGTCGAQGDNLTWELSCEGVLTISGTGAMDDYSESSNPVPWKSNTSAILSVVIEHGVTHIGNYAFNGCSKLTSVSISNSVTSIGNSAFQWCGKLASLEIPNSVTTIGWGAFYDCDDLSSVTIPASVTNMGELVFYLCENLTSIDVAIDNPNYCSEGGVLFNKDKTTLIQYPAKNTRTEYAIPNTVTYIDKEAFFRCYNLTSITIPNSVVSLGEGAFSDCKVTTITLPNSLVSIGRYAFHGCKLSTITIPGNVTSIGEYAFLGPDVSSITCEAIVPPSITGNSFSTINRAIPLYVPEESINNYKTASGWREFTNIRAIPCILASGTCGAEGDNLMWELSCDSILIISGIGAMEDYCYGPIAPGVGGDPMPAHTPHRAKNMISCSGPAPWDNYTAYITGIQIADGVTHIGDDAFYYCSNLKKEVIIPQSVTSIGSTAFYQCAALGRITFNGVTPPSIGENSFYNCTCTFAVPCYAKDAYAAALGVEAGRVIEPEDCTSVPCFIASGTCGAQGDNLVWKLSCDSVLTISGTGAMADYNYYYSDYAPWNDFKNIILSVVAEEGITKIGNHAFNSCSQLAFVKLPNSVTYIGTSAFNGCSSLVSINIPDNIISIGESTFDNCRSLISIVIPNNVTNIGMTAFWQCSGMTSLTIGKSVTNIGTYAFYGCTSLNTIYNLAQTPQLIDDYKFYAVDKSTCILYVPAESIEQYQVADVWKEFTNIMPISGTDTCLIVSGICGAEGDSTNVRWALSCDSVLTISGTGAMADYGSTYPWYENKESIRTVIIENGVTTIETYAFSYCSSLTSVEIPNSVISIGNSVFTNCNELTSINVDSDNPNYSSLDGVLFNKEKTLLIQHPRGKSGSYTIPNTVTSIGERAFYYCRNLTSIRIPNTVSNIGEQAFYYCSGLDSIEIPNSLTYIGERTFYNCSNLTSIEIPNSVEYIGERAFYNCRNVLSVVISNSVEAIERQAFSGCRQLKTLSLGASIVSIGKEAFKSCDSLSTITCYAINPPTLESSRVFYNTNKSTCLLYVPAQSITAYQEADEWREFANILPIEEPLDPPCVIASGYCGAEGDSTNLRWEVSCDSVLTISGTGEMASWASSPYSVPWYSYRSFIKAVILNEGLSNIGYSAFYSFSNLPSIVIPASVIRIANNFGYCNKLMSMVVAEGNPIYDSRDNCNAIIETATNTLVAGCNSSTIPNSVIHIDSHAFSQCINLISITIPNSVKTIGEYAFNQCSSLTSIRIPASVDSIGTAVFSNDYNLTSINVDSNNPNYSSEDGILFNKDKTILIQCPSGKQSSYTIPNSVVSISSSAFRECRYMTSIDIPNGVTTIEDFAFLNCQKLQSIKFPKNITKIDGLVLSGCSQLKSITCEASTPPTVMVNSFTDANKSIPLYVPAESLEAYKTADQWNEFTNILPIGDFDPEHPNNPGSYKLTLIVEDSIQGYTIGSGLYDQGATAHIEAAAKEGYEFIRWSDNDSNAVRDIVIISDSTLTAYFSEYLGDDTVYVYGTKDVDQLPVGKNTHVIVTDYARLNITRPMTIKSLLIEKDTAFGQVSGVDMLQAQSVEVMHYFDRFIDEGSYRWFAFSVPFEVSVANGIFKNETHDVAYYGVDFVIDEYDGYLRATTQDGWKRVAANATLYPGRLYMIASKQANTWFFKALDPSTAFIFNVSGFVQFGAYQSTIGDHHSGWNGIANILYENAYLRTRNIQYATMYDNYYGTYRVMPLNNYMTERPSMPFFVQASRHDTIDFMAKPEGLSIGDIIDPEPGYAPSHQRKAYESKPFVLGISNSEYTDMAFVNPAADKEDRYTIGEDLVKLQTQNPSVPQIWVNAYDARLAAYAMPADKEKSSIALGISAPEEGVYTLSIDEAPQGKTLFIAKDGVRLYPLSNGEYDIYLEKGLNTNYSIHIYRSQEIYTGVENITTKGANRKMIKDGQLYILRQDGKLFNANGIEVR